MFFVWISGYFVPEKQHYSPSKVSFFTNAMPEMYAFVKMELRGFTKHFLSPSLLKNNIQKRAMCLSTFPEKSEVLKKYNVL